MLWTVRFETIIAEGGARQYLRDKSCKSSPVRATRVLMTMRAWAERWDYRLCWLGLVRTPPRQEAGRMGGIGLSSGKNCTVGRLVANPWASQQHDGGRVVEIGASDPICVHIRPEKQALLSVLRESVRGSCQEPSVRVRKQRKALRHRTATRWEHRQSGSTPGARVQLPRMGFNFWQGWITMRRTTARWI